MQRPKHKLRVFLDANVLFSAAYREQAGLAILWKLRRIRLLTSLYATQEAANNLGKEDQQSRLRVLLEDVETVPSEAGMNATVQASLAEIVLPDKDRPILAAAVAAKADFLLTGDIRHFGRYFNQTVCGVRLLRPAEFLKSFAK
jgi:predicted nucleic acid-binding protein